MKTGDKLYFLEEKRPYSIRALGKRYAVCTKPFNPKSTVLYTIVDFEKQIRGTENLIFCLGTETDERCEKMLQRLENGETEISCRNYIDLNIV